MAPINPVYFVVSDSSSSPSGSRSGSGSGSSAGSSAAGLGGVVSTPVESLHHGSGGSYFEQRERQRDRHHHHHHHHHHRTAHAAHPRGYAHLLLGTQPTEQTLSRASSITSLGSGSSDGEESGREESEDDAKSLDLKTSRRSSTPDQQTSRSTATAIRGQPSHRRTAGPHDAPPRVTDFFPTTQALRQQATEALAAQSNPTTHGPYADSLIDNPAPPRKKQRRYCPEPNCCGNALSHPGKAGNDGDDATRVHDLFWKRQSWLMEHRGADGLSHCGSEEEDERGDRDEEEDHRFEQQEDDGRGPDADEEETTHREPTPPSMAMAKHRRALAAAGQLVDRSAGINITPHAHRNAASHEQVLRTAGAGLPLARVKRVMKGADEEIKVN